MQLITNFSEPDTDLPTSTASIIGIIVAISGNVIISLALNCQKLAHHRLEEKREKSDREHEAAAQSSSERQALREGAGEHSHFGDSDVFTSGQGTRLRASSTVTNGSVNLRSPKRKSSRRIDRAQAILLETEPLLRVVERNGDEVTLRGYGLGLGERVHVDVGRDEVVMNKNGKVRRGLRDLFSTPKKSHKTKSVDAVDVEAGAAEVEVIVPLQTELVHNESDVNGRRTPTRESFDVEFPAMSPKRSRTPNRKIYGDDSDTRTGTDTDRTAYEDGASPKALKDDSSSTNGSDSTGNESDYLKSKLWWFGFLLMNIGEMGNFISYGFAPASVVAPLGTFALIANCIFAPFMLGEKFRKRDFFGITLAILGAVTVVLATNPSDVRLDPAGLIRAISQQAFIALAIVYIVGVTVLVGLSNERVGREWVFIDVGICAFFGGFTVLSTKGISTLLTMEWWAIVKEWITYPLVAVMIGTGIGQIKYLNRALMKFDSKVVIPTQFVLFNLSAIVGSAVLYGDFRKATFHQMMTFLYGCGATFTGVFILTWTRGNNVGNGNDEVRDTENMIGREIEGERAGVSRSSKRMIRRARSSTTLMGLSPAQRVLLVEAISH